VMVFNGGLWGRFDGHQEQNARHRAGRFSLVEACTIAKNI
jgi:hypothetical protein